MKSAILLLFAATAAAQTFEVAEASIADLQKALSDGRATSKSLVQAYLNRIDAFDRKGPKLNAMVTLNPNAIKEAEALDRERASKGPRGPLHGIPVIVKDNYGTVDLPTTAGTMALLGFLPARDAFQVRKLREAGAVILGKSNLHELASGITTVGSAAGQTLNPYDPTRNPGGSSGGTGAAIAASYAAAGMGSDTCGSIRIPSSHNNLVGLRPTKGLSSIAGIVPLSVSQDVGGPLARSVSDLAVMLDATIGEDDADAATRLKPGQARPKFSDSLQPGALKGARIGVLEPLFGDTNDDPEVLRTVRAAIDQMKAQGAVVVSVAMPDLNAALEGTSLIDLEFQEDLKLYLAENPTAPVHTLAEIVDSGFVHSALETILRRRLAGKGRGSEDYNKAMAKRAEVTQSILKRMDDDKLDALVYPTIRRKPAHIGDPQGGATCQLSATTGFPALSVPAGFTNDGLPVGIELFGRPFDDGKLVSLAFDYESATHNRRAPSRTPALNKMGILTWQSTGDHVQAKYLFDPTTNNLTYTVTASGYVSATIHRVTKEGKGPVVAIVSNRPFQTATATAQLSNPDRDKLMAGDLYLLLRTASKSVSLPVKPR
jgi:Asp-tRNA(Asn)/Glu-tRNA(Gln) amidotransferase A subunit family amidase